MLFWDASALVKAYSGEDGTPAVLGAFKASRGRGFLTELVALEVLTVFAKQLRTGKLSRREYRRAVAEFGRDYPEAFHVVPVDDPVLQQAFAFTETYREIGVGAMDLLHLASALRVQRTSSPRLVVVVTADAALSGAAVQEGLGAFNPETDPHANLLSLLYRSS